MSETAAGYQVQAQRGGMNPARRESTELIRRGSTTRVQGIAGDIGDWEQQSKVKEAANIPRGGGGAI